MKDERDKEMEKVECERTRGIRNVKMKMEGKLTIELRRCRLALLSHRNSRIDSARCRFPAEIEILNEFLQRRYSDFWNGNQIIVIFFMKF